MTLAIALPRGSAIATPTKRRVAPASSKPTTRNGRVSPVARNLPLEPLRRFQASGNTYLTGLTPRQQTAALWRLSTTHYEREMRHAQATNQEANHTSQRQAKA